MDNEQVVKDITELKSSMKTAFNRLDGQDKRINGIESKQDIMYEMNSNIRLIAQNQEYQGKELISIKSDVKELKEKPNPDIAKLECEVREIKEKPAKKWDSAEMLVLSAAIGGVVTFIITKVLGG